MRVLAATLAVPVALLGWQWWSDHSLEAKLSPIASGVAGRTVHVNCQAFWTGLVDVESREGEVRFDADGIPQSKLFMTRGICKQLKSFSGKKRHHRLDCLARLDWTSSQPLPFDSPCYHDVADTVYAVLILAHEAYHTAGVTTESTTNCYAIQAMAWTAMQLGASQDEAELVARAMEALEPSQDTDYATTECHAGRSLDLHPETADFPTEHPIRPPLGVGGMRGIASGAS
jgi:hypothetical protein